VFRAGTLSAGSIAAFPLNAYRQPSFEPIESKLLNSPHPDLTDYEFWEVVMMHLQFWGNHYSRKIRLGFTNTIGELHPIAPWRVRPRRVNFSDDNPWGKVYDVTEGGKLETLTPEDIFHIPGVGFDGLKGLSVIGLARQSFEISLAAEEYAAQFFNNGALKDGILKSNKTLKEGEATRLKRDFMEKTRGIAQGREPAVLSKDLEWIQLSIDPGDAQFLESRQFQIADVARWFGVAPWLLFDVTKTTSWGSGIEQQGIGYVVYNLRFWVKRIEKRVTRDLLPRPQYAKFNMEGLLRGDTKSRFEAYSRGRQWGWLSVNDIREKEDMEPIESGDIYLTPVNMADVDDLDKPEPAEPAEPNPEEVPDAE
jgi:HK97 family phage portal protein